MGIYSLPEVIEHLDKLFLIVLDSYKVVENGPTTIWNFWNLNIPAFMSIWKIM